VEHGVPVIPRERELCYEGTKIKKTKEVAAFVFFVASWRTSEPG
jgi:hypothetical protein